MKTTPKAATLNAAHHPAHARGRARAAALLRGGLVLLGVAALLLARPPAALADRWMDPTAPVAVEVDSAGGQPADTGGERTVERRVFTYLYYWYEPLNDDPYVLERHDELTTHFPPGREGDWRSVGWFREQFVDLQRAGVDVALAVYWGDELYPETVWSTIGLRTMVRALDDLDADGLPHPKVGLFLDTYVLDGADLTDPPTITWLANQLKAFFRRVPERHLAMEDGRPIIWLYLSNFANDFNPETFERLDAALEPELGARPFWIAEQSWAYATRTGWDGIRRNEPGLPMEFDGYYRWGAASAGMLFEEHPLPIASVGPGYDDRAIEVRGDERSERPRESGCFYARNWRQAQAAGARWVVVETWNELFEGSAVAETAEFGRAYVDATAAYAGAFKDGEIIGLPTGCSAAAQDDQAAESDLAARAAADPGAGDVGDASGEGFPAAETGGGSPSNCSDGWHPRRHQVAPHACH